MSHWHHLTDQALADALTLPPLAQHRLAGLSDPQPQQRRQQYGANALPERAPRSLAAMFLGQFADLMILVLLVAALLAGWLGELADTLVILAVVLLNGVLGFAQEFRAQRALAALRQLAAPTARVLRAGQPRALAGLALVPGDLVLLEAGNRVPADLRLLDTTECTTQESALTGESAPVAKQPGPLPADTPVADQHNMAFQGTLVLTGKALGLVVATGGQTQLGQIATLLKPEDTDKTPLQLRLSRLGQQLSWLVLAICALVLVAGLLRHEPLLLMLMTAITLAVAAIPEALPAVVAVALALGSVRLAKQNALVRQLAAVETLGSVTYICADKTGTLTENRMRLEALWLPLEQGRAELLQICALNNDARAELGDPTELALLAAAREAGLDPPQLQTRYPRLAELPFDSARARMTTLHQIDGHYLALCKGAPEALLPLCDSDRQGQPLDRAAVLAQAHAMASQGLRLLAFAQRRFDSQPERDQLEQGLCFLGLAGLLDPPRAEAMSAVRECRQAGMVPVMITGDHPATALAIAERLALVAPGETVLSGQQLAALDDAALSQRVTQVHVYARVDPAQKIRIVEALQARGEFVAMTGDGVNDAPALQRADIGIAMGKGGTDIARDAANLVLLDDNFASIVAAVREGRRIYDNIRTFVRYALTTNSSELWLLFLAPFFGLPLPLLPVHILWVNLLTDGLPGLSLALEPGRADVMQRPPRPRQEGLFSHGLGWQIFWLGLLMAGCALALQWGCLALGLANWQTMVFTALTATQLCNLLAVHAGKAPALGPALFSNPALLASLGLTLGLHLLAVYLPWANQWLKTAPLSAAELGLSLAVASLPFWAVELHKAWRRCR